MFGRWERILERSGFAVGCPVVATVTDAVSDDALRGKAAETLGSWRSSLTAAMIRGGVTAEAAEPVALLAISALEGDVVLARAEHDLAPLFFFSSRRRHTRSLRDWSSDVCSSD